MVYGHGWEPYAGGGRVVWVVWSEGSSSLGYGIDHLQ